MDTCQLAVAFRQVHVRSHAPLYGDANSSILAIGARRKDPGGGLGRRWSTTSSPDTPGNPTGS